MILVHIPVILSIILITQTIQTSSGTNNLYFNDGPSTAQLIAGDVFFEIVDPEELEYTYRLRPAKDFGLPFHGCVLPRNIQDVEGNVAFIERGECSFKTKALIAERAGAQAAIITDTNYENEEFFIEMIDDDVTSADVNIPAAFLMGRNGIMILNTLRNLNLNYALINLPVNLTYTPIHKINQPPWTGW